MNGERRVNTLWMHNERFVNGECKWAELRLQERTVNAMWVHSENTEKWKRKVEHFRNFILYK